MRAGAERPSGSGLLGDSATRDYAAKLERFHAFAAPELTQVTAALGLKPGMHLLDAGCGTGEMLCRFHEHIGAGGLVIGLDLAQAHLARARARAPAALLLQADAAQPALRPGSFDLVWSLNTVNHLRAPRAGIEALAALLKRTGRLVLAQSSFLPDMYFAWDARLERLVNEAVRQYYRERYDASERDFTAIRASVGLLRATGLRNVTVRSWLIERVAPLSAADEAYLLETQFRGTWGERLRPYLSAADFAEVARLCDPTDRGYALRRPDFHFLQTLSVASGQV
jgi:ubiquinone/menaquinone biosynthesis C-methylase UbiE